MKQYLFNRRILGLGVVVAVFAALPAQAAFADTSSCPSQLLSQPFLSYGDSNEYVPIPGESFDNVDGTGWTLSGGASLVSTTLADGSTGQVLDLPPGSSATSPLICIQSGEPFARAITQMAGTNAPSNNTQFQAYTANGTRLGGAMPILGKPNWQLSPPVNVAPGNFPGSLEVYFTLTANSKVGDLQIYNMYIDPRWA